MARQARAQLPSDIPVPVPEHRATRGGLGLSPVYRAVPGGYRNEPEPPQLFSRPYCLACLMRRGGPPSSTPLVPFAV